MVGRAWRRLLIAVSGLAIGSAAQAVTLNNLRDSEFRSILGRYAPHGDCSLTPQAEFTASGLAFTVGTQTRLSTTFEYATTFFGPDYSGISKAIFPFPDTPYEPGRVLIFANADERPGVLAITENLAPGERLSPFEAALVQSSPLEFCRPKASSSPIKRKR